MGGFLIHLGGLLVSAGVFLVQNGGFGRVKCDLLLQCCKTKYLEKQVKQIVTKSATFADVLLALERQYPPYKTDLSIRAEILNLAVLPNNPKPARISELLADLTPGSYGSDELLFWLVAKLPREPTGRVPVNGRAQGEGPQLRGFVCATLGAGAGERKRPAAERLPSWRRRLWEPWQRVPATQTWTGDYPEARPYHGQCPGALLV